MATWRSGTAVPEIALTRAADPECGPASVADGHGQGAVRRRCARRRPRWPRRCRPRSRRPSGSSTTSASRLTGLFAAIVVVAVVGAVLARLAHPTLGHPADRPARRRGATRARGRARFADPDPGSAGARVARRSTSTPCAAASVSSSSSRSGRGRRSSRARRWCSRSARSSNRSSGRSPTGGRSPGGCGPPRASSRATATTCSRTRWRRTWRSSSSTSPATARPRASSPCAARRCCAPRSRRVRAPGVALDDDRRDPRRHGRRGVPHRVRRRDRHRQTDACATRTPVTHRRTSSAPTTSSLSSPPAPWSGCSRPAGPPPRRCIPAGDNLCAYTDGVIETRNADKEFFGPERLVELLQGARCDEAPAVVQALHRRGRAASLPTDSVTTPRSSYCVEPT